MGAQRDEDKKGGSRQMRGGKKQGREARRHGVREGGMNK